MVLGDFVTVMVRTPTKLQPHWRGPWLVLRVLGERAATLELMKGDGMNCIAAMANVKLWQGEVPNTLQKHCLPQVQPSATKNDWSSNDSDSLGSLREDD